MKKEIVTEGLGQHNLQLDASIKRLQKVGSALDQSTICVIPSRGIMPTKVVQNWFGMLTPMNQKFFRICMIGMEVGEAYNSVFEMILNHPELSKWKYVLTLEDDNMVPQDGLLKLLEDMQEVDVAGGLYWTKGEGGQPMIYGNPAVFPRNYIPQQPVPGTLQRCNGLGMGFTIFKLDIFRDLRLNTKDMKPWFKTVQEVIPGKGTSAWTQDLFFFEKLNSLGYRIACDTRVLVGHYDLQYDMVW